ncbi:hypothetical protein Q75_07575 [Bacillus coahuilensis p1.1.43]|uniref:4,4'-diaponeurosporenoate glycosyltransferase n=1 Tax=Bacillus coahuilensis p1.1.43 TaxID=1150625 RepID=A0A147K8E5_9BACI|nr:glycosyltransferase [Bacillus coahuilensis]KUP06395.1 hypothetical protein Q75_07575 [Bacillus coahuilensis p1.1.43]
MIIFLLILVHVYLFWRISYQIDPSPKSTSISIIIPARNEENNIETLLSSLGESKLTEIIVVNDQSTDCTKEISLQYGVVVIDTPPLPTGWLGKSWACWNGAKHAKGDFLVFVDADTWFPRGSSALQTLPFHPNLIYSIHPYHVTKTFIESLSSFFHLIVAASSGATKAWGEVLGGYGQCMVISKQTYFTLGGHRSIKSEIVENLSLLQYAKKNGYTLKAFVGKNILHMRMYSSLSEMTRGWAKSFSKGAIMTPLSLLMVIILWISLLYTFTIELAQNLTFSYFLGYVLVALILNGTLKYIINIKFYSVLLFPFHLLFFFLTFLYSLFITFIRKNATWKGRNIVIRKDGEDIK